MNIGLSLARILVIVTGLAIALLGLWLIILPGGPGTIVGIWTVLGGLALVVGAAIERIRYRSEASDRAMRRLGVVRREEADDLALRVAQLEHRVRLLETPAE